MTHPHLTPGAMLRTYRQRAGLTQRELATRSGISVRTVRDLERDRIGRPRNQSLAALATVLELSADVRAKLLGLTRSSGPALAVGVLGPLDVRLGASTVEVAGAKQRRLLSLLALQPDRTVSRAEISAALWGERPPASATNLVHTYVGALRRALEPNRSAGSYRTVVRSGDGYRLVDETVELDVSRFERLAAQGRAATADRSTQDAAESLAAALACWRGRLLGDADPVLSAHPAAVALAARRVDATLAYADAAVGIGRHDDAVAALRLVLDDEPLHEGLHARLIRSLAGSGRQAAALDTYEAVRRRLADDLGVDPGEELRSAHLDVLRQQGDARGVPAGRPAVARADEPGRPVPVQLPLDVRGFVGRSAELARLDEMLAAAGSGAPAVAVAALTGTAGVGKTALALHWAHQVAHTFGGGQLYVNLRGYDPGGPVEPAAAVRGFLDALGIAPSSIPAGLAEQVGLYRSLIAGQRVLVVLDNARDPQQVRPLLPGSPGCMALVTSRDRLTGLVAADGAHPVAIEPLTIRESRKLLDRRLGAKRTAAEPAAVERIVAGCVGLPLALTVVAARAATEPALALGALADELRSVRTRLDALDTGELSADIRTVFSWSYETLDAAAQRLFRLLALHPGPDLPTRAAADLAGISTEQARAELGKLRRANLLIEDVPGRYGMHDLLRVYAAELVEARESTDDQRAALHRVIDHYVLSADRADALVYPERQNHPPPAAAPAVAGETFADRAEAMAWFGRELAVLLAIVRAAASADLPDRAWHLAWTSNTFLHYRGDWASQVAILETAVTAAARLPDRSRLVLSYLDLGRALGRHRRSAEAVETLGVALKYAEDLGDQEGAARIELSLARIYDEQGDHHAAARHTERAGTLFEITGNRRGQANALNGAGWSLIRLGEYRSGIQRCRDAAALNRECGDLVGEGCAWDSIGVAYHRLGDHEEAITCLQQAIELLRNAGDRYDEAHALEHLAEAHRAEGDNDGARRALQEALRIFQALGDPGAERVQATLAATPTG